MLRAQASRLLLHCYEHICDHFENVDGFKKTFVVINDEVAEEVVSEAIVE